MHRSEGFPGDSKGQTDTGYADYFKEYYFAETAAISGNVRQNLFCEGGTIQADQNFLEHDIFTPGTTAYKKMITQ
jgi:hypothetical protein